MNRIECGVKRIEYGAKRIKQLELYSLIPLYRSSLSIINPTIIYA